MKSIDLGDGAMVTELPQDTFALRVDRRTRQARLRLNEFLDERARIIERGDRWLFIVENGSWNWPDFENGMTFRVEDGRIVHPDGDQALDDHAEAAYARWWAEKESGT